MPETVDRLVETVNPETRQGLTMLTALAALLLSLYFLSIFVAPIPFIARALQELQLPDWIGTLTLAVVVYFIVIGVSSSDPLYYGDPKKNSFVRAFQSGRPSVKLAETERVAQSDASSYWFTEFNKWADPKHERHADWKRTLQRGFACRFVYYIQTSSRVLLTSSVALVLFDVLCSGVRRHVWGMPADWELKVLYVLVVALLWVGLRALNRTGLGNMTGVWRRFEEVNRLNAEWLLKRYTTARGANAERGAGAAKS